MPTEVVRSMLAPPSAESSSLDLVAEANHRIANSLSVIAGLVHVQASAISKHPHALEPGEVRLVLEEFGGRIAIVAGLHRLLANAHHGAMVDLADYLRDVSHATVSSLSYAGHAGLRFASEPECCVPAEKALPLGLIVGELVTNAVKYAHPAGVCGQVEVECHSGPAGVIVVSVSDDGVGLPEGLDPMKSESMGLRLVRALADQVAARIAFRDTGLGLSVVLQMKKDAVLSTSKFTGSNSEQAAM